MITSLDLEVQAGEVLTISGPSGSGKSTLLNMIGLLEPVDSGRLELFGQQAPRPGSSAARLLLRNRLGYLFQNFALVDNATVSQNLSIAQTSLPLAKKEKVRVQAEALERVGLSDKASSRVFELSGGEQQRVSMARLMLKPCDLILADEPTGSLDPQNRDDVLEILRQFAREGKAVVMVTHDPDVIESTDRNVSLVDV